MREHESVHPQLPELADQRFERWRDGAAPGKSSQPIGARVEADCQPVTRDRQALTQQSGILDHAHRQDDPRGARREGEADVLRSFHAAGKLDRDGDSSRDLGDGFEVGGLACTGSVEVDQVDDRRS